MKNERALVFAEIAGQMGVGSVAHVYNDGYVLAVPMTVDRQLAVLSTLRRLCPSVETARSPDGMFAVFVLPADLRNARLPTGIPQDDPDELLCHVVTLTADYHDHRAQDHYRIEDALALYREIKELSR
jgi:hypothetical protein